MNQLWIEETTSTNTFLKECLSEIPSMTMLLAKRQSAGRGQRGNSWESEPLKNLTFSFYIDRNPIDSSTLSPLASLHPRDKFAISEAVALGVSAALADFGISANIKWPNDIYVGEKKIAGILIENSVQENSIIRSIVGIGINVNQIIFRSDAPNPVSMAIVSGQEFPLPEVAEVVGKRLREFILKLPLREDLHNTFINLLWRHDGGIYPFKDSTTGECFLARIKDVEYSGLLVLETEKIIRKYAFKELAYL